MKEWTTMSATRVGNMAELTLNGPRNCTDRTGRGCTNGGGPVSGLPDAGDIIGSGITV